jgi:transcriptional regulator with XRE-family HTH domain
MTSSAVDSSYSRTVIGTRLRGHRERCGMPLRRLADELQVSAAKWSRVENGEISVRSLDVERACQVFGDVDEIEIKALMELAKQTKSKSWVASYDDVVSANFRRYISLEEAAEAMHWYETDYMPSLLQTDDYARAIIATERFTGRELAPESLERRLEVRMNRQRILDREQRPLELEVVLSEAALLRVIGSAATMAGQLEHLLDASGRRNIAVRVVPLDREHGGLTVSGQFILLDFPPLAAGRLVEPSNVYVDGYLGFHLTAQADDVDVYRAAWASLWETAYDEQESTDFIERRLRRLRTLARSDAR